MFVKDQFRGKEYGIGQKLLGLALTWSGEHGFKQIFLETTDWLAAASRFYLKNNFSYTSIDQLPSTLPVLRPNGKFMSIML